MLQLGCLRRKDFKTLFRKNLNQCSLKNVASAVSVCVCVQCRSRCCTCPSPSRAPKLGRQAGTVARKAGVIQSAHNAISPNMTSSYNLDFLPEMMVDGRLLGTGERM